MIFKLIIISLIIYLPLNCNAGLLSLDASYLELSPSPPFTGNLAPNTRLQKASYFLKGKLVGPETLEMSKEGLIYTGLATGEVISIDLSGNIKKIAFIGNPSNQSICELSGSGVPTSKAECGRPLGLRLKGNFLYVADAFFGIVKIDLANGQKTTVLSSKDPRFGDRPLKFTNDLDIDDNGVVYFVDTSYLRDVNDFLSEYFEAQPRGRLFSYNERTNELKLLLNDLYFPNGIQLTPSKDALLVDENTQARIIKYYLTGDKRGQVEVFAVLPGFSDSIRLTPKQTLLVPFGVARNSIFYSLLDLLGKVPFVRSLLGSLIGPGNIFKAAPKYGLLVEYDLNGNILRSWHDPSGKVIESTSSAVIIGDKIYIGSLYIDFIAVVDY